MKTKPHNNKMKGNALVFALLIVAVTSVIAYALIETSTFAVRRTTQLNNIDDCQQAVHAAELYAGQLLFQDEKDPLKLTELNQPWAQPFEMQLKPMLTLKAQLTDMQGQFNVNALAAGGGNNPDGAGIYSAPLLFTRLMILLNIPQPQALEQAASQWVSESSTQDDQIYLELNPAYRVPHAPMVSISELNLVRGFSQETLTKLAPYISALSGGNVNTINVNTAPAYVLAALLDISEQQADVLVNDRKGVPFPSNTDFVNRAKSRGIPIADDGGIEGMVNVNSQYFLLKTEVTCQKNNVISYSFINRLNSGQVKVYRRTAAL